jgi:hypothetical protein
MSRRTDLLKERIQHMSDPEDIMQEILDIFNTVEVIPDVGKFYTFVYLCKTPDIRYDQHPLIACMSVEKWGFKGYNFHWRKHRNYTWMEVTGQMHVIDRTELNELIDIPFARYRLNN